MSKIINPPCNSLMPTSFIKPDERKKKEKVVVEGVNSIHVDGFGTAWDVVGVPFNDQFPLISACCTRLFVRWMPKVQRLTTSRRWFLLTGCF